MPKVAMFVVNAGPMPDMCILTSRLTSNHAASHRSSRVVGVALLQTVWPLWGQKRWRVIRPGLAFSSSVPPSAHRSPKQLYMPVRTLT